MNLIHPPRETITLNLQDILPRYSGESDIHYQLRSTISNIEQSLGKLYDRQNKENLLKQFREVRYTTNSIQMRRAVISRLRKEMYQVEAVEREARMALSKKEESMNLLHSEGNDTNWKDLLLKNPGVNTSNPLAFNFVNTSNCSGKKKKKKSKMKMKLDIKG